MQFKEPALFKYKNRKVLRRHLQYENVASALTPVRLVIVGAVFQTTNSECRSIMGLPILPVSIERFKPPPLPGPVGSDRTIPIVDFHYQFSHRLPAEVKCDLGSNVQIDS